MPHKDGAHHFAPPPTLDLNGGAPVPAVTPLTDSLKPTTPTTSSISSYSLSDLSTAPEDSSRPVIRATTAPSPFVPPTSTINVAFAPSSAAPEPIALHALAAQNRFTSENDVGTNATQPVGGTNMLAIGFGVVAFAAVLVVGLGVIGRMRESARRRRSDEELGGGGTSAVDGGMGGTLQRALKMFRGSGARQSKAQPELPYVDPGSLKVTRVRDGNGQDRNSTAGRWGEQYVYASMELHGPNQYQSQYPPQQYHSGNAIPSFPDMTELQTNPLDSVRGSSVKTPRMSILTRDLSPPREPPMPIHPSAMNIQAPMFQQQSIYSAPLQKHESLSGGRRGRPPAPIYTGKEKQLPAEPMGPMQVFKAVTNTQTSPLRILFPHNQPQGVIDHTQPSMSRKSVLPVAPPEQHSRHSVRSTAFVDIPQYPSNHRHQLYQPVPPMAQHQPEHIPEHHQPADFDTLQRAMPYVPKRKQSLGHVVEHLASMIPPPPGPPPPQLLNRSIELQNQQRRESTYAPPTENQRRKSSAGQAQLRDTLERRAHQQQRKSSVGHIKNSLERNSELRKAYVQPEESMERSVEFPFRPHSVVHPSVVVEPSSLSSSHGSSTLVNAIKFGSLEREKSFIDGENLTVPDARDALSTRVMYDLRVHGNYTGHRASHMSLEVELPQSPYVASEAVVAENGTEIQFIPRPASTRAGRVVLQHLKDEGTVSKKNPKKSRQPMFVPPPPPKSLPPQKQHQPLLVRTHTQNKRVSITNIPEEVAGPLKRTHSRGRRPSTLTIPKPAPYLPVMPPNVEIQSSAAPRSSDVISISDVVNAYVSLRTPNPVSALLEQPSPKRRSVLAVETPRTSLLESSKEKDDAEYSWSIPATPQLESNADTVAVNTTPIFKLRPPRRTDSLLATVLSKGIPIICTTDQIDEGVEAFEALRSAVEKSIAEIELVDSIRESEDETTMVQAVIGMFESEVERQLVDSGEKEVAEEDDEEEMESETSSFVLHPSRSPTLVEEDDLFVPVIVPEEDEKKREVVLNDERAVMDHAPEVPPKDSPVEAEMLSKVQAQYLGHNVTPMRYIEKSEVETTVQARSLSHDVTMSRPTDKVGAQVVVPSEQETLVASHAIHNENRPAHNMISSRSIAQDEAETPRSEAAYFAKAVPVQTAKVASVAAIIATEKSKHAAATELEASSKLYDRSREKPKMAIAEVKQAVGSSVRNVSALENMEEQTQDQHQSISMPSAAVIDLKQTDAISIGDVLIPQIDLKEFVEPKMDGDTFVLPLYVDNNIEAAAPAFVEKRLSEPGLGGSFVLPSFVVEMDESQPKIELDVKEKDLVPVLPHFIVEDGFQTEMVTAADVRVEESLPVFPVIIAEEPEVFSPLMVDLENDEDLCVFPHFVADDGVPANYSTVQKEHEILGSRSMGMNASVFSVSKLLTEETVDDIVVIPQIVMDDMEIRELVAAVEASDDDYCVLPVMIAEQNVATELVVSHSAPVEKDLVVLPHFVPQNTRSVDFVNYDSKEFIPSTSADDVIPVLPVVLPLEEEVKFHEVLSSKAVDEFPVLPIVLSDEEELRDLVAGVAEAIENEFPVLPIVLSIEEESREIVFETVRERSIIQDVPILLTIMFIDDEVPRKLSELVSEESVHSDELFVIPQVTCEEAGARELLSNSVAEEEPLAGFELAVQPQLVHAEQDSRDLISATVLESNRAKDAELNAVLAERALSRVVDDSQDNSEYIVLPLLMQMDNGTRNLIAPSFLEQLRSIEAAENAQLTERALSSGDSEYSEDSNLLVMPQFISASQQARELISASTLESARLKAAEVTAILAERALLTETFDGDFEFVLPQIFASDETSRDLIPETILETTRTKAAEENAIISERALSSEVDEFEFEFVLPQVLFLDAHSRDLISASTIESVRAQVAQEHAVLAERALSSEEEFEHDFAFLLPHITFGDEQMYSLISASALETIRVKLAEQQTILAERALSSEVDGDEFAFVLPQVMFIGELVRDLIATSTIEWMSINEAESNAIISERALSSRSEEVTGSDHFVFPQLMCVDEQERELIEPSTLWMMRSKVAFADAEANTLLSDRALSSDVEENMTYFVLPQIIVPDLAMRDLIASSTLEQMRVKRSESDASLTEHALMEELDDDFEPGLFLPQIMLAGDDQSGRLISVSALEVARDKQSEWSSIIAEHALTSETEHEDAEDFALIMPHIVFSSEENLDLMWTELIATDDVTIPVLPQILSITETEFVVPSSNRTQRELDSESALLVPQFLWARDEKSSFEVIAEELDSCWSDTTLNELEIKEREHDFSSSRVQSTSSMPEMKPAFSTDAVEQDSKSGRRPSIASIANATMRLLAPSAPTVPTRRQRFGVSNSITETAADYLVNGSVIPSDDEKKPELCCTSTRISVQTMLNTALKIAGQSKIKSVRKPRFAIDVGYNVSTRQLSAASGNKALITTMDSYLADERVADGGLFVLPTLLHDESVSESAVSGKVSEPSLLHAIYRLYAPVKSQRKTRGRFQIAADFDSDVFAFATILPNDSAPRELIGMANQVAESTLLASTLRVHGPLIAGESQQKRFTEVHKCTEEMTPLVFPVIVPEEQISADRLADDGVEDNDGDAFVMALIVPEAVQSIDLVNPKIEISRSALLTSTMRLHQPAIVRSLMQPSEDEDFGSATVEPAAFALPVALSFEEEVVGHRIHVVEQESQQIEGFVMPVLLPEGGVAGDLVKPRSRIHDGSLFVNTLRLQSVSPRPLDRKRFASLGKSNGVSESLMDVDHIGLPTFISEKASDSTILCARSSQVSRASMLRCMLQTLRHGVSVKSSKKRWIVEGSGVEMSELLVSAVYLPEMDHEFSLLPQVKANVARSTLLTSSLRMQTSVRRQLSKRWVSATPAGDETVLLGQKARPSAPTLLRATSRLIGSSLHIPMTKRVRFVTDATPESIDYSLVLPVVLVEEGPQSDSMMTKQAPNTATMFRAAVGLQGQSQKKLSKRFMLEESAIASLCDHGALVHPVLIPFDLSESNFDNTANRPVAATVLRTTVHLHSGPNHTAGRRRRARFH
ncbi:hypothetical protein BJ742DRAFT_831022 [Cladochytrium replicatum]|nr:hypothetical protein BJ742DRAFT_831022 [Cladochytrium replicatum]